jgi:hypothetical protein
MHMRGPERPQILWQGLDRAGYFRGQYRDGGLFTAVAIAVPGRGSPPRRGPAHDVMIAGKKVGAMPDLKSAQTLAELHLLQEWQRGQDRQRLAGLELLVRRRPSGR